MSDVTSEDFILSQMYELTCPSNSSIPKFSLKLIKKIKVVSLAYI